MAQEKRIHVLLLLITVNIWTCLSCKMMSLGPSLTRTASLLPTPHSSFVVNMDGIVPLDEVDTLLSTWASFPEDEDQPPSLEPEEEDKVLHATMSRTVRTRPKDTGAGKRRAGGISDPS